MTMNNFFDLLKPGGVGRQMKRFSRESRTTQAKRTAARPPRSEFHRKVDALFDVDPLNLSAVFETNETLEQEQRSTYRLWKLEQAEKEYRHDLEHLIPGLDHLPMPPHCGSDEFCEAREADEAAWEKIWDALI